MRRDSWFKSAAFSVVVTVAVGCSNAPSVRAQQPDATKFNQTYETAAAKARKMPQPFGLTAPLIPFATRSLLMGKNPLPQCLQIRSACAQKTSRLQI